MLQRAGIACRDAAGDGVKLSGREPEERGGDHAEPAPPIDRAAAGRCRARSDAMETDPFIVAISDNLVYLVIGGCFLVAMVLKALTSVVRTVARERSRREIAAYIAEGSITSDQGERLLKAEVDGKGHRCA
jgi:hypothetical protein